MLKNGCNTTVKSSLSYSFPLSMSALSLSFWENSNNQQVAAVTTTTTTTTTTTKNNSSSNNNKNKTAAAAATAKLVRYCELDNVDTL